MILNCGAVLVQWRPCSRMKTVCLASPSATAEQLRQQLDNLHKEADNTRAKANNARLRLIRLSEAVEKLRRQAAVSVQTGNENDARELLFQKKKVMQAMEKLKSRIELFDELSAKLNEAISMKESLLIGNMALDVEVSDTEAPSPIRIVSPTEENPYNTDDNQHVDLNNLEFGEDQELQVFSESKRDTHADNEWNSEESFSKKRLTGADSVQSLREVSTYEDFMKHLDQQLNKIEEELETFLRYSNLLLENKEKPEYSKVHHVTEILAGVCHIRERIATIKQTK
ncbi:hypothetical protein Pfo_013724 [Paulownia fortunei]|nr:hypothetical protein Pfo_013724 [Paulownia fortunei]